MKPARHAGAVESTSNATSYTDTAGAYMDLDSGGTFAQFGAKGPGSIGLKLRTVLAGVALTVLTFTSAGVATFLENVNMSAGKTFAAQAVTATTIVATGAISTTATGAAFSSTGASTASRYSLFGNTSGLSYFGTNGSASIASGGTAYAAIMGSDGALPVELFTNSATRLSISGAGAFNFKSNPLSGITTLAVSSGATFGGAGVDFGITTGTSDGADSGLIYIAGGGAVSETRGAYIYLPGNEHAANGAATLASGNHASAFVGIKVAGIEKLKVDQTITATHTALSIWDVDNAALERVTVGAADSGGAGFKLLRVPN